MLEMRRSSGVYGLAGSEVSCRSGRVVSLARAVLLSPIRHSYPRRFRYSGLASGFSPRVKRLTIIEDVPLWAKTQIISAQEKWSHGWSWYYASMNSFHVGDSLQLVDCFHGTRCIDRTSKEVVLIYI